MRARHALLLASLVLLPLPARPLGDSVRCSGGLVSVGDAKLDVLGKCGQPTLRDVQEQARTVTTVARAGVVRRDSERRSALVERWTYDFGPSQFVYHVILEGGRVVAITHGSYGYSTALPSDRRGLPVARCEPSIMHPGDSVLDLLARCGEPALRDLAQVERSETVRDGDQLVVVSRTVDQEVWTYNFGANRFIQLVTVEAGQVKAVESGGYGYPAP